MTPVHFYLFFAYEYQKYAEYYPDSKSVEIMGKKYTLKRLFANNFGKLVVKKRTFVSKFFLNGFKIIVKFCCFDTVPNPPWVQKRKMLSL